MLQDSEPQTKGSKKDEVVERRPKGDGKLAKMDLRWAAVERLTSLSHGDV